MKSLICRVEEWPVLVFGEDRLYWCAKWFSALHKHTVGFYGSPPVRQGPWPVLNLLRVDHCLFGSLVPGWVDSDARCLFGSSLDSHSVTQGVNVRAWVSASSSKSSCSSKLTNYSFKKEPTIPQITAVIILFHFSDCDFLWLFGIDWFFILT